MCWSVYKIAGAFYFHSAAAHQPKAMFTKVNNLRLFYWENKISKCFNKHSVFKVVEQGDHVIITSEKMSSVDFI